MRSMIEIANPMNVANENSKVNNFFFRPLFFAEK